MLCHQIFGNLTLPFVSVREKFFLIVQKLFVGFCGEFEIRTFHDSVYRTCFLAESTIDALCHVNIVSSCSAGSILTFLNFNRDCLRWACSFAKLTGDTTFLSGRVATESMLSAESRGEISVFEGVIDCYLGLQEGLSCEPECAENFREEKDLRRVV